MNLLGRIWPRSRPLDLSDPQVARDPFPHYERLRRDGPVQFMATHGFWIVLGHDEVKSAFERPKIFSNAPYADIDAVLLAADPPRHSAVRRLISRHFSAEALDRLTAAAIRAAESLAAPELDVVGQYGGPISRSVAAELIGFADADVDEILRSAEATMAEPDPIAAFIERLDGLADRGRLFEALCKDGADLLTEPEARSLIRLLWLAATTTTERVISRGILRLMQHEDVQRMVRADRALLVPFIEEVMRLHPPEHMVPRLTLEAVRLGECEIPAGADVRLCVSAASRDPARYEDPAALRLDREYKRHFAFGGGVHQCVGAPLTRRVVVTAIGALLDRTERLRPLQPLDRIDHYQSMTALTPLRLMVGLESCS